MSDNDLALKRYTEMVTWIPDNINLLNRNPDFPLITTTLDDLFNKAAARKELMLPNLHAHNKTVMVFSDYGGEAKDARFQTYSIMLCSYDPLHHFFSRLTEIRGRHRLNTPYKEIAFKDLNYGPLKRALPDLLANYNNLLPGVVVTIAVEKTVETLFGDAKKATHAAMIAELEKAGFGSWKGDTAEKTLRILHTISYLVALLAKEGQNIFWMTDHDAIAANDGIFEKTRCLLGSILKAYSKAEYGKIGCAVPFEEKTKFTDLLSLPDIVGGSIEHYLSREQKLADLTISEQANEILLWHSEQGISLKKYAFIFRKDKDGLMTGSLSFEPKEPIRDLKCVYISP